MPIKHGVRRAGCRQLSVTGRANTIPINANGGRMNDINILPEQGFTPAAGLLGVQSDEVVVSLPSSKIRVRNLNFFYGRRQALRNVNLEVMDRSVTAIIGPSGCGKSTLLRVFNRMFDPYPEQRAEGEILFDGVDLLHAKEGVELLRRRVGMVFQKPEPFPMSIYQNVAFGLKMYEPLSRSEIDDRVQWALTKAALWSEVQDKLKDWATSLSGGQQQRLCIARTIAIRPEVLLLDEPCSALDPRSTARIESLIEELKSEFAIVIVTHNLQQAARCADFVAYMYQGELLEFGTIENVFSRPSRKETEDYICGRFG